MFGGGGNAEQGRNNSKNRMFLLLPVAVAGLGVLLVIVGVATDYWMVFSIIDDDRYDIFLITNHPLYALYSEEQKEKFKEEMKEETRVYGLSNDQGDKYDNANWCVVPKEPRMGVEECGYLGPVIAMCVLGILAAAAGILLALGHVALGKTALMPAAGGAACLLAGLFTLIGVIIFATQSAEYRHDVSELLGKYDDLVLGWSFALTTVGGVLFLAAGALMLVIVLMCK